MFGQQLSALQNPNLPPKHSPLVPRRRDAEYTHACDSANSSFLSGAAFTALCLQADSGDTILGV